MRCKAAPLYLGESVPADDAGAGVSHTCVPGMSNFVNTWERFSNRANACTLCDLLVIAFLKSHGYTLPDDGINELSAFVFYEVEDAASANNLMPL